MIAGDVCPGVHGDTAAPDTKEVNKGCQGYSATTPTGILARTCWDTDNDPSPHNTVCPCNRVSPSWRCMRGSL